MIEFDNLGSRIILYIGDSGKVFVSESVCYLVIIAVILSVLGIWLGSNLEKVPKGKQVIAETFVGWAYGFAEEHLGKEMAATYAPYLGSLIVWIAFSNMLGLIGLRPPTADVSITAGLAFLSFLLIQGSAIKHLGVKGRISELAEPFYFMIIMETISEITFPVTLALRLFGNIFGGMVVVEMFLELMGSISEGLCGVPFLRAITVIPLNLFFDLFEPLIQAYIFTVLTAINLKRGMEGPNPEIEEKRRLKKERRKQKRAKQIA